MGILINVSVILFGGFLGGKLQKFVKKEYSYTLGIGIIIVSLVGFFENVYNVKSNKLTSGNLVILIMAFIIGSIIGKTIHLEDRFSNLGKGSNTSLNAIVDTFLFFGIGGFQILGPIALATNGDNSQLILKSVIDIPFAIIFGATYGKITALAAIPVGMVQVIIFLAAKVFQSFFTEHIVAEICAMGYIILFFSGFNLLSDIKHKISNIDMLPAVILILIISGVKEWMF